MAYKVLQTPLLIFFCVRAIITIYTTVRAIVFDSIRFIVGKTIQCNLIYNKAAYLNMNDIYI